MNLVVVLDDPGNARIGRSTEPARHTSALEGNMDMRAILQLPKNIASCITFSWGGNSVIPRIEIRGSDLLELHGNDIWLTTTIANSFLDSRILWQDFDHELKFVEPKNRGETVRQALLKAAESLKQALAGIPGKSAAHLEIVDSLANLEMALRTEAREIIVSVDDYNRWVADIGGDNSEKMSESEHLEYLVSAIKSVRLATYPLWTSLIALLPEGHVKADAEARFRDGCKSVGIDTQEVSADWVPKTDNG